MSRSSCWSKQTAVTWSNCKSSWYDRKHWIPLGLDADPMVCKHRVSWQPIMCNFKFHKTWLWNMLTRQHSMDLDLAIWVQCASLDCLPENGVLQYCVFWVPLIGSSHRKLDFFHKNWQMKSNNWINFYPLLGSVKTHIMNLTSNNWKSA